MHERLRCVVAELAKRDDGSVGVVLDREIASECEPCLTQCLFGRNNDGALDIVWIVRSQLTNVLPIDDGHN